MHNASVAREVTQMTWNERVCGQEEGGDNTTVPLEGQGNFSPSGEGQCLYAALGHPN